LLVNGKLKRGKGEIGVRRTEGRRTLTILLAHLVYRVR